MHPPLERLTKWCDLVVSEQREIAAKRGHSLGCPVHSLGAEVSTWEGDLQLKIQEAIAQHNRYFESALRDAAEAFLPSSARHPYCVYLLL